MHKQCITTPLHHPTPGQQGQYVLACRSRSVRHRRDLSTPPLWRFPHLPAFLQVSGLWPRMENSRIYCYEFWKRLLRPIRYNQLDSTSEDGHREYGYR
jgi:hypothetical protein